MHEIAEIFFFNKNGLKALCQMLQTKINPHQELSAVITLWVALKGSSDHHLHHEVQRELLPPTIPHWWLHQPTKGLWPEFLFISGSVGKEGRKTQWWSSWLAAHNIHSAVINFPDSFLSFDIAAFSKRIRRRPNNSTDTGKQEHRSKKRELIADLRKKWFSTDEEETKNAECSIVAAVGLISSLRRHPS